MPRTAQDALYAMLCMVLIPWARGVTECATAQNRCLLCCALFWCILGWLIPMASGDNGQGNGLSFAWCGFARHATHASVDNLLRYNITNTRQRKARYFPGILFVQYILLFIHYNAADICSDCDHNLTLYVAQIKAFSCLYNPFFLCSSFVSPYSTSPVCLL